MKPGIPWSVKGIEPEVREAAKYAARRSGLSLGEWLNGVILEQADADEDEDFDAPPPRRSPARGERLGRVADRLGRMDMADTAAGRYYGARERGPDPRLVSDVLERLAANERRTESAFETITDRLEELAAQIAQPRPGDHRDDSPGLRAVESAIRNIVNHMEVNEKRMRVQLGELDQKLSRMREDDGTETAIRRIETRLVDMTRRLERAESGEHAQELLGVMESHIARMNDRIDSARQPAAAEMARMRAELGFLKDRVQELQETAIDAGTMAVLKADVQTMGDALRADLARVSRRAEENGSRFLSRPALSDDGRLAQQMAELQARVNAAEDQLANLSIAQGHGNDVPAESELAATIAELQARVSVAEEQLVELSLVQAPQADTAELAQQIHDLQARVSTAESQLVQMSVLEQSVQEIMARLDAAPELAAHNGPSPELSALEAALQSLSASAQDADERTQSALQAVQQSLEDITAKIAAMEAEAHEARGAEPVLEEFAEAAPEPEEAAEETEAEAPASASAAAWQNILRAHVSSPAYTAPPAEGTHEPLRAVRLDAMPEAAASWQPSATEDFVAAARRAALEASPAEEPAKPAAKAKSRFRKKEAKPAADKGEAAAAKPARRRKLLMAAVVLLMAVSAYNLIGPKLKVPKLTAPAQTTSQPAKPSAGTLPQTVPAPRQESGPSQPEKSSQLTPGMAPGDTLNKQDIATASTSPAPAVTQSLGLTPEFGPASLRQAVEKGDATALFVAGTRYLEAKGISADPARAAELFGKAAAQGLAPAQYRLATLYELGRGVTRNVIAARDLYERSATQGNVKAMHNLAVLLSSGDGEAKPDYAGALKWFEQAARHGLSDSQYNLAVLYDRGAGTEADPAKAAFWYGVLADKGDADAASRTRALQPRLTTSERKKIAADVAAFQPLPSDAKANQVVVRDVSWQGTAPAKAKTPLTEASAAPASEANVREVHRILTQLGYSAGEADGKLTERLANAVRVFQLQNGMAVNGMIDAALIERLKQKAG